MAGNEQDNLNEQKYKTLFETMNFGVVYQDASGYIISANPTAETILGLSLDQMQGRTSVDPRWKAIHEDGADFSGETHPAMVALQTGEKVSDVIMGVFNPHDDQVHWININAVPLFKPGEKKPYQVYATFEDITERKRAEYDLQVSETRYRRLFESAKDGILILDYDTGMIVDVNPFLIDMLGYPHDQFLDKTLWDVGPFKDSIASRVSFDKLQREGYVRYEDLPLETKDGRHIAVEFVSNVYDVDSTKVIQCNIRDITDRKRLDDLLKKKTFDLAERVKELSCLYLISTLTERSDFSREDVFTEALESIPFGFQYPEVTCARIIIDGAEYKTGNFVENEAILASDIMAAGKKTGSIEIGYLEEKPEVDKGPFIKEEVNLINAIARLLGDYVERKRAEEEISQLAKFPSENPNPVLRIDEDGTIIYANDASAPLLKYWGVQVNKPLPQDWRGKVSKCEKSGFPITADVEYEGMVLSLTLAPVPDMKQVNIYGLDVTERRRAEEQIHHQNEFLNTVLESQTYKVVLANSASGFKEDLTNVACHSITHASVKPCRGEEHPCPLEIVKKTKKATIVQHIHYDENGKARNVEVHAHPIFDKKGNVIQVIEYSLDVTERKQEEDEKAALLDSARAILKTQDFSVTARTIFDNCKRLIGATAGYVALLSEEGSENEVLFLDSGGLDCTVDESLPMPIRGLRGDAYHTGKAVYDNDFMNSKWVEFMPQGHVDLNNVMFVPLVVQQKAVGLMGLANKPGGFNENDARLATAFGELASIALLNSRTLESLESSEQELKDYSENLEKMVEERTVELKSAHEKLLRSGKLAAIGQFSAGVAHDLRNPLNIMYNAIYLLKLKLGDGDEKINRLLEMLETETKRSNDIIGRVMDFARTEEPQIAPIDIHKVIDAALSGIFIPVDVEIVSDDISSRADLPAALVDSAQIARVFSNIINNVVQAMSDSGKLTISARADADYIITEFEDTGVGIAEENLDKIFEPLFTTKHKTGGTGIGLAASKAIVEAHKGDIEVKSREGKGTTITVKLPAKRVAQSA